MDEVYHMRFPRDHRAPRAQNSLQQIFINHFGLSKESYSAVVSNISATCRCLYTSAPRTITHDSLDLLLPGLLQLR